MTKEAGMRVDLYEKITKIINMFVGYYSKRGEVTAWELEGHLWDVVYGLYQRYPENGSAYYFITIKWRALEYVKASKKRAIKLEKAAKDPTTRLSGTMEERLSSGDPSPLEKILPKLSDQNREFVEFMMTDPSSEQIKLAYPGRRSNRVRNGAIQQSRRVFESMGISKMEEAYI
jgi:hypothetical protein